MRKRPSLNPTHKMYLYEPGGNTIVFETYPTGRAKGFKGDCKYCYRTHKSWWQMKPDDYDGNDIVLCAYCEHTMLRDLAET